MLLHLPVMLPVLLTVLLLLLLLLLLVLPLMLLLLTALLLLMLLLRLLLLMLLRLLLLPHAEHVQGLSSKWRRAASWGDSSWRHSRRGCRWAGDGGGRWVKGSTRAGGWIWVVRVGGGEQGLARVVHGGNSGLGGKGVLGGSSSRRG